MTAIDSELFRDTASGFATGVTVVSVRDELDDVAMTATSFTSVSLDPPMVLLGLDNDTHMHEVMHRNDTFGVTVLAAGQQALAGRFGVAGRPSARLLLAGQAHHRGVHSNALLIDNAVTAMECRITTRHGAGDHTLIIATVLGVDYINDSALPLLRYRRRYHQLA